MLGVAAIIACGLVVTSIFSFGHVAMWSIILVGLFNSIMWPNIYALGLMGLGTLTNRGSSLLMTGVIGGALIPLLQGFVADHIGIHHAYVVPPSATRTSVTTVFEDQKSSVRLGRRQLQSAACKRRIPTLRARHCSEA